MVPISDIFSEPQLRALQDKAPTPLYFRLYSLLKTAILDGTIATGVQLPTEAQLADTFAVSR
ncbi:MAG: GntR family transcriptional regulator, partial [Pseudomonadota bacterium]